MTPNTYDRSNFKDIIATAPNLFHQTSVKSIADILRRKAIVAPGTLWGIDPAVANAIYQGNPTRLSNLKLRAERGFVDYIFCSFSNGLQSGFHRYGYVAIEVKKSILLEKEAFIYPFNFVTSWNHAHNGDKYSDLSTWDLAVSKPHSINISEVLIRRQIKLDTNAVRLHCYSSHSAILIDQIRAAGLNLDVVVHGNPSSTKGVGMSNMEKTVQIGTETYRGMLSDDSKFITIFDSSSDDDIEILGRFEIVENQLIEFFPLTGRKQVVGHIVEKTAAPKKVSAAQ